MILAVCSGSDTHKKKDPDLFFCFFYQVIIFPGKNTKVFIHISLYLTFCIFNHLLKFASIALHLQKQ